MSQNNISQQGSEAAYSVIVTGTKNLPEPYASAVEIDTPHPIVRRGDAEYIRVIVGGRRELILLSSVDHLAPIRMTTVAREIKDEGSSDPDEPVS